MDQRALWACAGGLASTAAVSLAVAAFGTWTGFNLFSFSLWLVLPVGAMACGAAALSGFYLVSHRTHLKPGWWMVAPLIAFAAIGYMSIYYFEYQWLTLDDGSRAADLVSFGRYLDVMLSNQEMRVGRGGQAGFALGEAGRWLAGLQLVGFMMGGGWIYWSLRGARACLSCEQYLRERGNRTRFFRNTEQAEDYYGLFEHDLASDEFARKAALGAPKQSKSPTEMLIRTQLLDCDGCHRQLWIDRPSSFNGKEWRELPGLNREIILPPASNVARFVRGNGLPSWLT